MNGLAKTCCFGSLIPLLVFVYNVCYTGVEKKMKQFGAILKLFFATITCIGLILLSFFKVFDLSTIILISFYTLFSLNFLCWIEVAERISKKYCDCGEKK